MVNWTIEFIWNEYNIMCLLCVIYFDLISWNMGVEEALYIFPEGKSFYKALKAD